MHTTVTKAEPVRKSIARTIHTTTSKIVGIFVLFHLFNHLFALGGPQQHIKVMNVLRIVYRQPVLEVILIIAVALQVVTGMVLVAKGWKQRRSPYEKWQAFSGVYLSFFFVVHLLAVLVLGRQHLHVDTNFYFAAAGLQQLPSVLFFVPYYATSVLSFGIHITCSLSLATGRKYGWKVAKRLAILLICITIIVTGLIMFAFSGVFYSI